MRFFHLMSRTFFISCFLATVLLNQSPATALSVEIAEGRASQQDIIPTEIVVRAKARDAKFIGSSIGGALVQISDAETGELLAQGLTQGSTGDTQRIMHQAKNRFDAIGENAAAFSTHLPLSQPMFLDIKVLSPIIKRQSQVIAQTQTWLIPGKPISGDGLILEIPGMIVDVLAPRTHLYTSINNAPFAIEANVVMMCGCIVTKGGIWNGDELEVVALIRSNSDTIQSIALTMQSEMNLFAGEFQPSAPGNYQVWVYAYDPKTGNTGVDRMSFVVTD